MLNSNPDGFVRCLDVQYGTIYEGAWSEGQPNGWGRMLWSGGSLWIGWWKNGKLHGNCRKFDQNGLIESEGWFANGWEKGGFKRDNHEFKNW